MSWQIFHYDEISSTNDIALERSRNAEDRFVVYADTQTAGRGRRGRTWYSPRGNLYFSVCLPYSLPQCGTLVMLCSLSLLQTIKTFCPTADVQLKWPNDVLLNNAKISGMLLEKGENDYMIVGIGVNITQSPDQSQILYPAISLAEADVRVNCKDFLDTFLKIFDKNIDIDDIASVRRQWLHYAKDLNKSVVVRQEKSEIKGIFIGIDENANLLLNTENGLQKILVGDVFYDG